MHAFCVSIPAGMADSWCLRVETKSGEEKDGCQRRIEEQKNKVIKGMIYGVGHKVERAKETDKEAPGRNETNRELESLTKV